MFASNPPPPCLIRSASAWPPRPSNPGSPAPGRVTTSRGFLIEGEISRGQLDRVASDVLVDPVVEVHTIGPCNTPRTGLGLSFM